MSFQKYQKAESAAPVTPQQNEHANSVREAGGQVKLATVAPPECQQPGACNSPNCGC